MWGTTEQDVASLTQLSMADFTVPLADKSTCESPKSKDCSLDQSEMESFSSPSQPFPDFESTRASAISSYKKQVFKSDSDQLKIDFFIPKKPTEISANAVDDDFIEQDVKEPRPKSTSKAIEDAKQFILFEAEVGKAEKSFGSTESISDLLKETDEKESQLQLYRDENELKMGPVGELNDSDRSFNLAVDKVAADRKETASGAIALARSDSPVLKTVEIFDDEEESISIPNSQESTVQLTFADIEAEFARGDSRDEFEGRHFFAKMEDGAKAEEELNKRFRKADFNSLDVIGQFNKGFIIAAFEENLFLIDQHASDEKFNFEKLMKRKLETQRLKVPEKLNLNPGENQIIHEKLSHFEEIGFGFEFRENEEVFLTRVPKIGNQFLDEEDIQEMLFLMSESDFNCKPQKVSLKCFLCNRDLTWNPDSEKMCVGGVSKCRDGGRWPWPKTDEKDCPPDGDVGTTVELSARKTHNATLGQY